MAIKVSKRGRMRDRRRDRRMIRPVLDVFIAPNRYRTSNWSYGGFLIDDFRFSDDRFGENGSHLQGLIGWRDEIYPFAAQIIWSRSEKRLMAVRFIEVSDGAFDIFDRCLWRAIASHTVRAA